MADKVEEIVTPGAAASAAADAAEKPNIAAIEAQVEANAQSTLDTLDAWKLAIPFYPKDAPAKCTKEKHTCNLEAEGVKDMCVGCAIYKRLVIERAVCQIGGRSDINDYIAAGVAAPIIFAFVKEGQWLSPMSELTGRWFVRHPVTFVIRPQCSLFPEAQVAIKRNRVRIFNGDELLATLGVAPENFETVYKRLDAYWHTKEGGAIYSIDNLLDQLGPIAQIAQGVIKLGLEETSIVDLVRGTARILDMLR